MRLNRRSLSPMMKNERKSYFLSTGVRTPVNASSPEAFGTRSTWRREARGAMVNPCLGNALRRHVSLHKKCAFE